MDGSSPHTPLFGDGKPLEWRSKRYRISHRLVVIQSHKMRARDDLKRTMSNLAFTLEAPIQLVSRGNIAQISHILSADGGDWVLFKADRRVAYIQLPIDPSDPAAAIVALRHPGENRRYGFVARTLICGSAAAVLRFNVLSRMIVALVNRYLGIPPVGYMDVFSAIIRARHGHAALYRFNRFFPLLGFRRKGEKSEVGASAACLGLLGSSTRRC